MQTNAKRTSIRPGYIFDDHAALMLALFNLLDQAAVDDFTAIPQRLGKTEGREAATLDDGRSGPSVTAHSERYLTDSRRTTGWLG